MKYDIEADWIINILCNYTCDYCNYHTHKDVDGVFALFPKHYSDFFDSTGLTWMLHMSGGEPLAYPKIIDVMKAVTRNHYLSLNTNGSLSERIKLFTEVISPDRVRCIHIGVHVRERSMRNGWYELFSNINLLKFVGFKVFASVVMEHELFQDFLDLSNTFWNECQCVLVPKTQIGVSYSQEEKILFSAYLDDIKRRHQDFYLDQMDYTISPMTDTLFLNGVPDFRGHNCLAGVKFVKIDEFGEIWRCENKEKIGSITTGEFNLHQEAYVCREQFCPYYCVKYSNKELKCGL